MNTTTIPPSEWNNFIIFPYVVLKSPFKTSYHNQTTYLSQPIALNDDQHYSSPSMVLISPTKIFIGLFPHPDNNLLINNTHSTPSQPQGNNQIGPLDHDSLNKQTEYSFLEIDGEMIESNWVSKSMNKTSDNGGLEDYSVLLYLTTSLPSSFCENTNNEYNSLEFVFIPCCDALVMNKDLNDNNPKEMPLRPPQHQLYLSHHFQQILSQVGHPNLTITSKVLNTINDQDTNGGSYGNDITKTNDMNDTMTQHSGIHFSYHYPSQLTNIINYYTTSQATHSTIEGSDETNDDGLAIEPTGLASSILMSNVDKDEDDDEDFQGWEDVDDDDAVILVNNHHNSDTLEQDSNNTNILAFYDSVLNIPEEYRYMLQDDE